MDRTYDPVNFSFSSQYEKLNAVIRKSDYKSTPWVLQMSF